MSLESRPFKIPESVLVVIHTPALDVLLLSRADWPDHWQSVTGSKDWAHETFEDAAVREVHEDLAQLKDVGYTTTLKLMQIMHEKGLVKRDDSMRTHVYQAAVNKEKTFLNIKHSPLIKNDYIMF